MRWKWKCLARSHLLLEQSSHARQQQHASRPHRIQPRNYHPGLSSGQRTRSIPKAMKQRALLGHLSSSGLPTCLADPGPSRMVDGLGSISLVGTFDLGRRPWCCCQWASHASHPTPVSAWQASDCQPTTGGPINCLAACDPTR